MEVENLLAQLAVSKVEYANAYLIARIEGSEIEGRRSTTDDARMWARRNLAERGIPDAESIRWRLTLLLGAPQVEGD